MNDTPAQRRHMGTDDEQTKAYRVRVYKTGKEFDLQHFGPDEEGARRIWKSWNQQPGFSAYLEETDDR